MEYLHGFSKTEQNRLIHQAGFLKDYIYPGIDLSGSRRLLEVGSGVGAQTKILLREFPKLQIDSVDFSSAQLEVARQYLGRDVGKRVTLHNQDVQKLSLPEKFDAAFLCWFLEHVPDPLAALKSVRRHLKSGAKIYCTEVFNHTLFLEPYSPAFLKYWSEFNDFQWTIKGHPFVGGQLGYLLKEAGFKKIDVEFRSLHFDARDLRLRNKFIDYFFDIFLSAEEALVNAGRVSASLVSQMKDEVAQAKAQKSGVFYYTFARGIAVA